MGIWRRLSRTVGAHFGPAPKRHRSGTSIDYEGRRCVRRLQAFCCNPKVTPARIVSGPTLLTGICFCAKCAGAMTLRTGKGNRYRY